MPDSPYLTLGQLTQCEIDPIKGSRFIGIATAIDSDAAAMTLVADIKSRYPDARHWCWAYQLREQKRTRFSDDGEPNGSAGKPILAPIVGRELLDSMVIVVRYFGGVKLGVGGLVRAYSQAANAVLDNANIIKITPKIKLKLCYRYDDTGQINTALASLQLKEHNPIYSDCVESELFITRDALETVTTSLTNHTAGRAILHVIENS